MKKLIVIIFAIMTAASLFAAEAKVVSVSGRVEVQESGQWFPLSEGDTVEKGAVISTGYKSRVVFEFKGATFTFESLTRGTIEDLIEEDNFDSASLFIESGKTSATVNKDDGRRKGFKVGSPVAVASVRGTSFTFTASGKLTVERGIVAFAASDSSSETNVWARQRSKIENHVVVTPEYQALKTSAGGKKTASLQTADNVETIGYTTAVIMYLSTKNAESGRKEEVMGDATFSFEF